MSALRFIWITAVFILLTVLTQVGGVVYLSMFSTHRLIDKRIDRIYLRHGIKFISFLLVYSFTTFLIVPILARPFGRVPMPLIHTDHVRPLNFITCFFNRHYVRPELKQAALVVATQMNERFPGTVINYLDAGFPFINGFPLVPHLSHNDGKKLDIAFFYIDRRTGESSNVAPSVIGYGISEEPRPNEVNTTVMCEGRGYWQYSFLRKIMPQGNKQNFLFDSTRTKALANFFILQPAIGKIFIEPHLKLRLKLTSDKIRFHGCQAVRHDDHIHVQLQ